MYFYCWVEICTDNVDCTQSCAIICEYIKFHLVHYMYFVYVSLLIFPLSSHSI